MRLIWNIANIQAPSDKNRPLVAERKAPPPPRPPGPSAPASAPKVETKPTSKTEPAAPTAQAPSARPERRISTMNEAQIMEKLRSVVSSEDPSHLYSKIKKVGQG